MPYITISNSKSIIKKVDLEEYENCNLKLYKEDIFCFSNKERAILLGFREMIKNPDSFFITCFVKQRISKDTRNFVDKVYKTVIARQA